MKRKGFLKWCKGEDWVDEQPKVLSSFRYSGRMREDWADNLATALDEEDWHYLWQAFTFDNTPQGCDHWAAIADEERDPSLADLEYMAWLLDNWENFREA
jgi:hypothetical protein